MPSSKPLSLSGELPFLAQLRALTGRLALVAFLSQTVIQPALAADSTDTNSSDSNSSDTSVGDSTAGTSEGSSDSAGDVSAVSATVSTVAAVVVIIVLIVKKKKKKEEKAKRRRKKRRRGQNPGNVEGIGRTLLYGELIGTQRDLGLTLNLLARSPTSLDILEAEAAAGDGPLLESLSTALQQPRQDLAQGLQTVLANHGPPLSQADANLFVIRLLNASVDDLELDPAAASDAMWRLDRERAHPDFPAHAPLHHRLARAMGVPVDAVVVAVTDTLELAAAAALGARSGGSVRATVAEQPMVYLDLLSDRIELADDALVRARYGELVKVAQTWDPTDELQLGLVD
jgi:hypothetical protein